MPTLFASSEKNVQWIKVVTNDSIATCSSALYIFPFWNFRHRLVRLYWYIRVYQGISKLFQNMGSVFWNVWDNFPDLSNTFFLKISNHIYQTSLRSLMWKHQKLRTITIDLYRNLCRGLGLHKSWGTPISICSEYLGLWKKRRLDTQAMSESPSVQMFTPPPCRFPDHNVVTSPGVASSGRGCSTHFG